MENSSSPNCKNILEGFFIEQGSLPAHQGTKSMTRQIGKNQMIAKNKYLFAGAIIFTAAFCSVLVLNISAGYAQFLIKTLKKKLERLSPIFRFAGPIPPILSARNWPNRANRSTRWKQLWLK
jgi:hypothetical protein